MISLPSGLVIDENISLKSFTSWLVGGPAEYLVQPQTVEQVQEALRWARAKSLPVSILGGGTNVLVADSGVRGLVLALKKLSGIKISERSIDERGARLELDCLAGSGKSELLKIFLKYKIEPALFLAGLPGDIGGGVAMNAGVGEALVPREFVEITDWVDVARPDGETIERLKAKDLQWSYRHCEGWRPGVIVRVGLSWPLEPKDDVLTRVRDANRVRLSKQPLDMPSCGSVFVNPPGHKSGQLVESCGLKGFAIGGAKVSEKHANFIVNFNASSAQDIDDVIKHVQNEVLRQRGVKLSTEVVYLGDW